MNNQSKSNPIAAMSRFNRHWQIIRRHEWRCNQLLRFFVIWWNFTAFFTILCSWIDYSKKINNLNFACREVRNLFLYFSGFRTNLSFRYLVVCLIHQQNRQALMTYSNHRLQMWKKTEKNVTEKDERCAYTWV